LENLLRNYEEVVLEQHEALRLENADRRKAEKFFRVLVTAAPHGMVMIDGNGRIKLANPELGRQFGFDPQELVGQPIEVVVPDAIRRQHIILRNRFLQNPQARRMGSQLSLHGQRKDGSQFPVEIGLNPITTEEGVFVLASVIDISERVRAEKQMRLVVEAAPTGMVVIDRSGTIQLVNSKTEEIFGYKRDDLIGQPIEVLIPARFREGHPRLRMDYFRAPVSRPMGGGRDLFGLRSDGTEFPVELGLNPLETEQGSFVLASVIDITTRKREADELATAKIAAETASRAKSEFLANMSHEIRTPMNAIMGMTHLALDTDLSSEQRDYLETVNDAAGALLVVINDILDFSKIEAGKLELDPQAFNLGVSLSNSLKTLAHRAFEKKVELIFELDQDIPERLIGDVGRLRQIIVNLIGNAIKFTERGEVILRVVKETEDGTEIALRFSVSDTGVGIPRDKLSKIFESFSQVDSSTTRRFGGTGLGLTISKHFVELMGGRIWVESELGRGSTFYFTMQFPRDGDASGIRPVEDLSPVKDLRVLVVDDNETNGQILEALLRSWNMRPVVAASGREALKTIDNAHTLGVAFQLVLTDCHMPEMDGFELAERLRARPETGSLNIIMLTSGAMPGSRQRSQELGMASLMLKPVNPSELLEAIQLAVVGRQRTRRPSPAKVARSVPPAVPPLRLLLAEDNIINQKVAVRLLEKDGHAIVVAGDGKEALEKFACETFDLILMDVQMPEMDGLSATAAIRDLERQTKRHTPIIALTAHAMQGDRDRFIAAGMDDFVSKPINPAELRAAIQRVVTHAPVTTIDAASGRKSHVAQEASLYDEQAALERIDGDVKLLRELMQDFLAESRTMVTEMRLSLQKRDTATLRRIAHTLKSMAGCFYATAATDAAFRLEQVSAAEKLDESNTALNQLETHLEQLQQAFQQRLS